MKFLTIRLTARPPDLVTGAVTPTTERFRQVIASALLAEELGFDGFGVGERHERPFLYSAPPVAAPAAPASTAPASTAPAAR